MSKPIRVGLLRLVDSAPVILAEASGLPLDRFIEAFSTQRRLRRDADLVAAARQLQDLTRDVTNEGDNQ